MKPNQRKLPAPKIKDKIAWALAAKGYGDLEICQRLHLTQDELELSKMHMTAHIAEVSNDVVTLAVNEELIAVAKSGRIGNALNSALEAERVLVTSAGVVVDPKTGVPITEPDHSTRLEAARTLSRLNRDNRPTGPQVQVAINNSNTQNNLIAGGRSFEARRRAAAERRGVVTGGGAAVAVAEAEVVDEDEIVDAEFDDPDAVDEPEEDEEE